MTDHNDEKTQMKEEDSTNIKKSPDKEDYNFQVSH